MSAAEERRAVDVLRWLVGDADKFLHEHWGRTPLHLRRADPQYYRHPPIGGKSNLFGRRELMRMLPLPQAQSMRVVRACGHRRDERMSAPSPPDGIATRKWVARQLSRGYTVQLFSPQRHSLSVAALASELESRFGCLVGCSAYLTPAGFQGLAPHHDDVCVFILQTEGEKKWRVYPPFDGHEMPRNSSGDLPRRRLGGCMLELTLRQGDLLYLPRGFVHEASASGELLSTHLTLSTYQRLAWVDLLECMLPAVLRDASEREACLRRNLPIGFLDDAGSGRALTRGAAVGSTGPSAEVGKRKRKAREDGRPAGPETLHADRRLWAEARRMLRMCLSHAGPRHLAEAADELGADFFANRLPPAETLAGSSAGFTPGGAVHLQQRGPPPARGDCAMRLCSPQHRRLVVSCCEDGHAYVMLQHCLGNSQRLHMVRPRPPPCFSSTGGSQLSELNTEESGQEEEGCRGRVAGRGASEGGEDSLENDRRDIDERGEAVEEFGRDDKHIHAEEEEEEEEEEVEEEEEEEEDDDDNDDDDDEEEGVEHDGATWRRLVFPQTLSVPLVQLVNAYPVHAVRPSMF